MILCTTNPAKVSDVSDLAKAYGRSIMLPHEYLAQFGVELPDVPEPHPTYVGNVLDKAIAGTEATGKICIALDCGVEIVGHPDWLGVKTGRHLAAMGATREQQWDAFTNRVANMDPMARWAYDVFAVAVARPGQKPLKAEFRVPCRIHVERRGREDGHRLNGFLEPVGLDGRLVGKTIAQMSRAEWRAVCALPKAFRHILEQL